MEGVGIFYDHFVNFPPIWYSFPRHSMLHQKNLATLLGGGDIKCLFDCHVLHESLKTGKVQQRGFCFENDRLDIIQNAAITSA
jgi:hypothetical protein